MTKKTEREKDSALDTSLESQSYPNEPDSHAIPYSGNQARNQSTRISRDEMNLAEFPLTVLSKRVDPHLKTLEFSDAVKGKNGELVNRTWIITGADKFGLPTSSDDEVLLGLLKLTADDGVKSRKVEFTRYELLRVLRWTTEGRSYTRLQNALDRLSGVRIKATNAFYDNEAKLHSTRNFGIIDEYEINDGRNTSASFFVWSDVLFKSFQVGFIKKLDLDFYLDLKSAVSKRLFRYLDKHFWYKSRVQMSLFTFAHEKVGISRNYAYASSLRQQIDPAIEELTEKGLLGGHEYLGKGKTTEIILYAAKGARKEEVIARVTPAPSQHVTVEKKRSQDLVVRLIDRGIEERQAKKVTFGFDVEAEQRAHQIIDYFDSLIAAKSHLVSRSPQGFLFRAVQDPFKFSLPLDKNKVTQGSLNLASKNAQRFASESENLKAQQQLLERARARYLTMRKQELERRKQESSTAELKKMRESSEHQLRNVRTHLSPVRFDEAVEHGVEIQLLKAFPDFEQWYREHGSDSLFQS